MTIPGADAGPMFNPAQTEVSEPILARDAQPVLQRLGGVSGAPAEGLESERILAHLAKAKIGWTSRSPGDGLGYARAAVRRPCNKKKCACLHNSNTALTKQISWFDTEFKS